MRARTALVNAARGLTKSYGERILGCNPRNLGMEKVQTLSPELQASLGPLLQALESLSRTHNRVQPADRSHCAAKLSTSRAAEAGEGAAWVR